MSAELLRILGMSVLASSAAIVLVLMLRAPMRARFGARVAYATWLLVPVTSLVALLPPPTVARVLPLMAANNLLPTTTTLPIVATQSLFDPLPWLMAVWALGACIALLGLLLQQRNFVRALGRLSAIDADAIGADVIGADVLRAESTAGCPALIGAIRTRIVLPVDFEQRFDSRERELILAHERTHRARGDAQINALAALLRCVFWFNPLVYFAASRFRFDQELACDAVVISRFPEARRRYAGAMLKTQLADFGLPVGCHWQSSHPLKERIAMLKQPLPGRARSAIGAAVAIALIIGGTYAAWAAQPAAAVATKNADAKTTGATITFRIDSGAPQTVVLPTLREPFLIREGDDNNSWEWQWAAKPVRDGAFELATVVRHNGVVVSQPHLIIREGEPGTIKVGEDSGDKGFKGFSAQITLLRADAAHRASADAKASYRALRRIAYPESAIAANVQGVVYVGVEVAADGSVAKAHVDHVDPPAAEATLAAPAVAGVKTWTFDSARKNGVNVASDEIVAVAFALDPKGESPRVEHTALEPIGVSPEKPVAGDMPPSEDVSYRLMFPPHYPEAAVKARQSARMKFNVLVDEHGEPQSVSVAQSDPPEASPLFAQASIDAIRKWHFNPGIRDGKPRAGHIEVPIDFVLSDDDG